jgi:hypothetical protein
MVNAAVTLYERIRELFARILAHKLAIPTDILRALSQSFQKNAGLVPQSVHDRFLSNLFQLITHQLSPHRLCGLEVRVPGYRSRRPGFDSRRYQIF